MKRNKKRRSRNEGSLGHQPHGLGGWHRPTD
uniref:Uncharacterized protein n=1 Tax=Rhizophora mucronata TaxID=61149 RepID=A0A2P2PDG9_RHIMU